jgi:hypothetical protein
MRARIFKSILNTGTVARDYIRLVCGRKHVSESQGTEDGVRAAAPNILESFKHQRGQRESDHILTGKRVIRAMDEQLQGYLSTAERFANWVTRGSYVSLPRDDRRFTIIEILWDREAIRVQDDEGYGYVIPFSLIGPWPREEDDEQHGSGEST